MYIKNMCVRNFGSIKNFSCNADKTYQEILGDEQFVKDFYFLMFPSEIEKNTEFFNLVNPQTQVVATLVDDFCEKTFIWQNDKYFIECNGTKKQLNKNEFIKERLNIAFKKDQPVMVFGRQNVKSVQQLGGDFAQIIVLDKE